MGRVREVLRAMGSQMRKSKGSFAVYVVLRLIVMLLLLLFYLNI